MEPAASPEGKRPLAADAGEREEPNSLFGEILDWMLAPLLFLWPISIVATYHIANDIANHPFDQVLAQSVVNIAASLKVDGQKVVLRVPLPAPLLVRTDEDDSLRFQVRGVRGELLAGDDELPPVPLPVDFSRLTLVPGVPEAPPTLPPEPVEEAGKVYFRDARLDGEAVRVAYLKLSLIKGQAPALVQVAETRRKRETLVSRIISGVLLPQFAVIPLIIILVYVGLSKGLAPLGRLRQRLRERRRSDLSAIPIQGVPEEVRPLVRSVNEMMARLQENIQAQQRFIADAAHQMKTPLTGLKTQTELALRESDPRQVRAELQRIAAGTDRAAHLIRQLLMLARTEASHQAAPSMTTVDVLALARELAGEWVPRAMARHIDLAFEGEGQALVDGQPLLLREMLGNLIDNAIKYTAPGGHVTVRVGGEKLVSVEVEDDGVGIPASERERVFERFYRVLGNEADGSGLGLPIVQEIAAQHSVGIDLAAGAAGLGTRVTLVFPRRGKPLNA